MGFSTLLTALAAVAGVCPGPAADHRWDAAQTFVQPSPFNALQGLVIDHRGRLLAASVFGGQIWIVDRSTGAAKVLVDQPDGQADDIAIGRHGEMAWTSLLEGKIRYRDGDAGTVRTLASLPSINSIRFDPRNGKLYAAQVFGADGLWEIDPSGAAAPHLVAKDLGGLNGFDIGSDGMIYGPLMTKGEIARIDPATGQVSVIAKGLAAPSGVKIAPDGALWAVDAGNGQLVRIDRRTGETTVAARFDTALDNLAIGEKGEIYISDPSRDAIHVYTPATGKLRDLIPPRVAIPSGLDISDGRLWVADAFVLRSIDLKTKAIQEEYHDMKVPFPFTVSRVGGKIAVSSAFLSLVEIFDASSWQPIATITGLAAPSDAILRDDGSLIYSQYASGEIVRASGPDYARREVLASGLDGPVQMTVDKAGHLYVTERSGALEEIVPSSPGGKRTVVAGLMGPEGVAPTPWGTLVVAEVGRRSLVEVDPRTGKTKDIARDLPIGLTVPSPLPPYALPTGVAVQDDGTIYLSADRNNAIYRFAPCR